MGFRAPKRLAPGSSTEFESRQFQRAPFKRRHSDRLDGSWTLAVLVVRLLMHCFSYAWVLFRLRLPRQRREPCKLGYEGPVSEQDVQKDREMEDIRRKELEAKLARSKLKKATSQQLSLKLFGF